MKYKSNILTLVALTASLRVAHWQARTDVNDHRAIGDLYEAMDSLTDRFAETAIGRLGDRRFESVTADLNAHTPAELIALGLQTAGSLIAEAAQDDAQDLLNIAADMQAALNRAKYFLTIL